VTIIFPPGDILTSVVWEKEKDTKVVDLLSRLCQLRGLSLDSLKAYNDIGKKLKEAALQETIEQSGLLFVELIDKNAPKEKKKLKAVEKDEDDFDELPTCPFPKGIKEKLVPGSIVDIPLREQLLDNEWEALQKFKAAHADICSNYSDEFVMACLFSRKLDGERAIALLQNNFKFRKDKGFMNIPKYSELHPDSSNTILICHGARTKEGSPIMYMYPAANLVGQEPFTVAGLTKWTVWWNFVGVFADGMDGLRNGTALVLDLKDYGWKNFDLEYQKMHSNLHVDNFPGRSRKILVVDPPLIFSAIFKIAQTFLKAKIVARFQTITRATLANSVEKDNLVPAYGGTKEYSREQFINNLKAFCAKHEERLITPGRSN